MRKVLSLCLALLMVLSAVSALASCGETTPDQPTDKTTESATARTDDGQTTETEEQNIDLVKGHLVGEAQIRLTDESFMDIAYQISRIALGIGKVYLCLRMVEQQTDEFTTRIACRTK